MPEDPRILTREEVAMFLRNDPMRNIIERHDLAQRERIATTEEKVRLLECALKISAADANARMNEGNELRADKRRLREALEDFLGLVDSSVGVAGYHLNGNVAAWGELDCVRSARAALQPSPVQPAAPHGKDGNGEHLRDANKLVHPTACDLSGKCEARMGATGTTNCIHCGKELIQRADGNWYTWDAPEGGGLPQYQATAAPQLSGEAGEVSGTPEPTEDK